MEDSSGKFKEMAVRLACLVGGGIIAVKCMEFYMDRQINAEKGEDELNLFEEITDGLEQSNSNEMAIAFLSTRIPILFHQIEDFRVKMVKEDHICCICHEDLQGQRAPVLPCCKNQLHSFCMIKWIASKYSDERDCPLCRKPLRDMVYLSKKEMPFLTKFRKWLSRRVNAGEDL